MRWGGEVGRGTFQEWRNLENGVWTQGGACATRCSPAARHHRSADGRFECLLENHDPTLAVTTLHVGSRSPNASQLLRVSSALVLLAAAIYAVVNLIVDVLYTYVDPRIRVTNEATA